MKKLKCLLKKTRKVKRFVWKGILKNTPLSSKIHCYVKNRNGLYFNRYRSNCKSVRFLLRASPELVRKRRKVYLSSKHEGRGYLGGVGYQNRVLSKYLSLCTCNYPFYIGYKSLIDRVNFGQFKLFTDIEKYPFYVDATTTIHASYCQGNVVVLKCTLYYSHAKLFKAVKGKRLRRNIH